MAIEIGGRVEPPIGPSPSTVRGLPDDWELLRYWRPNVLLTGPCEAVARALAIMEADLQAPVVTWTAGEPVQLPSAGTLLITDAAAMSLAEQERLLAWLREGGRRTQVVTTTPLPLWPLVSAGVFLEALHYYLNVVHLEL